MKDIGQFCDRTTVETTSKIDKTESFQKSNTNEEQLKANKTEIQSNETAAKMIQQQRKLKKVKECEI